jgi:hypothetical protein
MPILGRSLRHSRKTASGVEGFDMATWAHTAAQAPSVPWLCGLVLFRQHDGNHALSNGRVARIGRLMAECFVVVLDLEKYHRSIDFERAKVMLFIGIIGLAEIVIDGDRLDDSRYASAPSAAMPGVMTARPVLRSWRRLSLRARIASVLVAMV